MAQVQPPPIFDRQIKPIFEARCIACHSGAEAKGGLRLDDREAALKGGPRGPVIIPGKSGDSRLVHLVEQGKMPIDEELSVLEVAALRAWIDAGAPWPDPKLAPTFTAEPKVEAFRVAVRNLDRRAVSRLTRDPALVRGRTKTGLTALHYAALYGQVDQVRALLDQGAEANAADADGITPLMWATGEDAKARLLIERGADVNAVSRDGKTPLIIAVGRPEASGLAAYLLEKGAKVTPDQVGALAIAAGGGIDLPMLRLLYPKVLDPKGPAGAQSAADSAQRNCWSCLDFMLDQGVTGPQLSLALVFAANSGDAALVRRLLQRGALVTARGPQGAPALLAAANSQIEPIEKVRLLLEAGADPNVPAADGRTALVYARERHPEVVPMLLAKGAK